MRKLLTLLVVVLLYCSAAIAQVRTYAGKVTDENGAPIEGVSILIKGTKSGTTTDSRGFYKLSAKPGDVLVISAVSFKQNEIKLGNSTNQNATLATSQGLIEEVVVTAGGLKTKKKEQGYASTVVNTQQLTAGKATSVASGLNGKVAGLQISGVGSGVNPNYRVVLRGMRSLTGNNEALIVLDNVIVPNAILGNLNPEDIDDIVVLNGAGATALYGSDASNGALIITTKKGKKGKADVKISNTTTAEQVAFYPKLNNSFGSGSSNDIQIYTPYENQQYGPAFDGVVREIGRPLADGSIMSVPYSATDAKKKFWKNGLTNQTDFSVSTGDDKSTLYFSGQYVTATGTVPKDKYNRTALRVNGTRQMANKLSVLFGASYTQNRYDQTTQTSVVYDRLLQTPAQVPLTDLSDWQNNPFANPNGYYNDYYLNPYFVIDNYRQKLRNDYFIGNAELKYSPLSWFDVTYRLGFTTRNQTYKSTTDKFTFSDFTKATTSGTVKKTDITGGVTDGSYYQTRITSDIFGTFKKNVKDFTFRLVAGASLRQDESKDMSASISGLVVPGLFNQGNSLNPPSTSESNYKARQQAVYGDLNIGYKNYIFLHATGRNDWVSILAPENRSFFYPAVDVSFVPTDAIPALKNIKAIDFLKIRGGWSQVGNVNLGSNFGAYRLQPTFSQGSGYPYNGSGGFTADNQLVAPSLKPEKTTGYEVGFDLNMLKNRITTNVTWYSTKTKDQTLPTNISTASGYSSYLLNTGVTSSKGLELTLHFTPVRTKDWDVTVGGNYTHLINKVVALNEGVPRLSLGVYTSGAGSYAVPGMDFPVLMGKSYKRDPQGRIIVDRITGYPSATDTLTVLGNAQAKDRMSLDISVRFKNFRFSALAEYRGGYYIYNAGGGSFDFSGSSAASVVYNRERFVIPNSSYEDPNNKGTYIANTNVTVRDGGPGYWTIAGPRTGIDETYITSAAFWKIREMSLAYDLPASLLSRSKFIKAATVSVQGRNLFLFMPKTNIYTDPEYSDGNGSSSGNAIGLTNLGQTPPSRYYGGTISITF